MNDPHTSPFGGCRFDRALQRLEGDAGLLKEQMAFFLREASLLLAAIRQAIAGRDTKSLRHSAHRIKGLVSTYDQIEASIAALELEFLGQWATLEGAEVLCDELERHVQSLSSAIRSYLAAEQGPAEGGFLPNCETRHDA